MTECRRLLIGCRTLCELIARDAQVVDIRLTRPIWLKTRASRRGLHAFHQSVIKGAKTSGVELPSCVVLLRP